MRISDWSSDVCSSDLGDHDQPVARQIQINVLEVVGARAAQADRVHGGRGQTKPQSLASSRCTPCERGSMHAGAALMGPSATLAALEGSSLRIGLVPISLYSGGNRSLEKLRPARIARRSISAADASHPWCSRNSRNKTGT